MESFLPILLHRIQQEYKQPPPPWKHHHLIPPDQWRWITEDCKKPSDFDTLRLRQQLIDSPTATRYYGTCEYGSVAVLSEPPLSPAEDIPWNLWGRILRLFRGKKPFTIYFLASPSLRQFPASQHEPIQPRHINGGYTYPCRPDTIVLYRAEDATRVLIHELQHASCLDHPERGVDHVEAETEAWAEILYTALLSRGDPLQWDILWTRQWAWLTSQNKKVRKQIKTSGSDSKPFPFPWRYTIGKEDTIRRWFSSLPSSSLPSSSLPSSSLPSAHPSSSPTTSLRLTIPPSPEQQQKEGVRASSLIL